MFKKKQLLLALASIVYGCMFETLKKHCRRQIHDMRDLQDKIKRKCFSAHDAECEPV